MNTIFEITTLKGQFYYDLFYLIAIVMAGVFFMIDGKRKNYPLAEWSLLFSSGIIFLIIGTKLFTYTPDEWKAIFLTGQIPFTDHKTILGGIIGAISGIWIAKKLIRFPHPVLDSFAVSFPIAMAIQRIGCFMAGCCFGTPTDLPWGVKYSDHAMPFYIHLDRGLISNSSNLSLAIHPNQLYQTIACLIIAFAVWRMKNFWKRPGNLFFTSITLYWCARFLLEFLRDGASNGIAGESIYGLKYVQWGLLAGTILMTIFILYRERKYISVTKEDQAMLHPVWYYISLCLVVLVARYWFTQTEFLFIELVLAQTTILQLNKLLRLESPGFGKRLAGIYALIFVFILSGTVIAQKTYNELTAEKTSRNVFKEMSLGYGNLQYAHYHKEPYAASGCGGTIYTPKGPKTLHDSHVIGFSIARIETYGKYQKLTMGGQFSGGWDTEMHRSPDYTTGTFDISPYMKYDGRWFGLGLGLHFGANKVEEKLGDVFFSTSDRSVAYVGFKGNVRLFPYDVIYTEFRYNDAFPYQLGFRAESTTQIVVGTGFGLKDGTCLEYGYDGIGSNFISANVMIKNKFGLKASVFSCSSNLLSQQMMLFALTYRVSQTSKTLKK